MDAEEFLKQEGFPEQVTLDRGTIAFLLVEYAKQELKETGINSSDFYLLIDRLQKHSDWKYPERKWSMDTYYSIAWAWRDKREELEAQVLKLENEMAWAELPKKCGYERDGKCITTITCPDKHDLGNGEFLCFSDKLSNGIKQGFLNKKNDE